METVQLLINYLVPTPPCHSGPPNSGKSRAIKSSINDRPTVIISYYLSLTEFQNRVGFFYCYTERAVISGLTMSSAGHPTEGPAPGTALTEGHQAKQPLLRSHAWICMCPFLVPPLAAGHIAACKASVQERVSAWA